MPPASRDFTHLLTAGPQAMAEAVTVYEDHLFTGQVDVSTPMLVLMVLDGAHPKRPFKPVVIPHGGGEQLPMLGRPAGQGQFGKFAASVAIGFHRLPPQVVRESNPFLADGDRLVYTALAAQSVQIVDAPHYATDFLLDVPREHQLRQRVLYACDGRGWLYTVARPDGRAGPPHVQIWPCQADAGRPGRYLHPERPGHGLLGWGLDVLASGFRRVFEGEQPQCSDVETKPKLRKHHRHRARRRRG